MAVITKFSNKQVLVIEDLAGMRTQLQMSLSNFDFKKLHVVSSIKDAIRLVRSTHYDIILCDYNLGDRTNGQQFLEHLRTRDMISRNVLFIMITGEIQYEKVVVASECAPDDYLLKPFTTEQFHTRLEALMERQEHFAVIDKASDAKDWSKALAECDRILADKDKYFLYASKIKGVMLLKLERGQEAAEHYHHLLAIRPLPWARLGLARALVLLGKQNEAKMLLREILEESPQYMAAYDFLGNLLLLEGSKKEALDVLQQAREISPGTMNRIRNISTLAVEIGRHDIAEEVMEDALRKHKYSPVREAADYAVLSKALIEQERPERALQVLDEARDSFKDKSSSAILAAGECLAHYKTGNLELAEAALAKAIAANGGGLSPQVAASVAEACLVLGREGEANELLKQMVQNNPEDARVHDRVKTVLAAAGKSAAEADAMVNSSMQEVVQVNNECVRKAEAGQLNEAVSLMCEAADRLPNNMQIVSNAALALALDLARNGYDAQKDSNCMRYRQAIIRKSPGYPKLAQINDMLKKIKKPDAGARQA